VNLGRKYNVRISYAGGHNESGAQWLERSWIVRKFLLPYLIITVAQKIEKNSYSCSQFEGKEDNK